MVSCCYFIRVLFQAHFDRLEKIVDPQSDGFIGKLPELLLIPSKSHGHVIAFNWYEPLMQHQTLGPKRHNFSTSRLISVLSAYRHTPMPDSAVVPSSSAMSHREKLREFICAYADKTVFVERILHSAFCLAYDNYWNRDFRESEFTWRLQMCSFEYRITSPGSLLNRFRVKNIGNSIQVLHFLLRFERESSRPRQSNLRFWSVNSMFRSVSSGLSVRFIVRRQI